MGFKVTEKEKKILTDRKKPRRFGGKTFRYAGGGLSKPQADDRANALRNRGVTARVVRVTKTKFDKGSYAIYIRGRVGKRR